MAVLLTVCQQNGMEFTRTSSFQKSMCGSVVMYPHTLLCVRIHDYEMHCIVSIADHIGLRGCEVTPRFNQRDKVHANNSKKRYYYPPFWRIPAPAGLV